MKKIILLLVLVCFKISYSQIQNEFYVDDVDVIEYVTINVCIDDKGDASKVTLVSENTTYKNQQNIDRIIEYGKSIAYRPDSELRNNCYDFTFQFVNIEYQNKELSDSECKKCDIYKKGEFRYVDTLYSDTKIIRRKGIQIEKNDNLKMEFKIDWQSPCEYSLTYLNVSQKEAEYLLGETINIKIIGILENGDYVYYSNLNDQTKITGVIKKIK
jgi:hypothetical protein